MADASTLPPQQYKQPSRKGKKAWRKNVDVSEVQSGLEDVREEIIKHGSLLADKASEDLFITDIAGSVDIQKAYKRNNKVLKADEILARRSAVASLDTHKRPHESRVTDGLEPSTKRKRSDHVSGKEYEQLRKIAYGGDAVKKDVVESSGDATYDPWAAEPPKSKHPYLDEKTRTREPKTLKMAPISMAKNGKEIRAVLKPQAGKSYNPVFEDWMSLVEKEGERAVEEEIQRQAEARKEEERQALIEKEQANNGKDEWESEWESEWEGIMSEREEEKDNEWLNKKRPRRKTPAERNKINRRKEEQRRKIHEEKMRTREEDIARVKAFVKELNQKRASQAADFTGFSDSSESEEGDIEIRRRKHGRTDVPVAPLELVLSDELEDSLRRLKPEGNLLHDRFRSMILRGRIESRTNAVQAKQGKKKATEKWSYKDWKLPV